jgi:hypothetical protein
MFKIQFLPQRKQNLIRYKDKLFCALWEMSLITHETHMKKNLWAKYRVTDYWNRPNIQLSLGFEEITQAEIKVNMKHCAAKEDLYYACDLSAE